MNAKTETTEAKKAPAKKPTTGTPKKPRAKKSAQPTAEKSATPAAPTLPTIKQDFRPSPAIKRDHAPTAGKEFACCIATAARMVVPGLAFGRPGDADHLRQLANITSWKELYNERGKFCRPLAGSAFIRAAMHTPGLFDDMQKELAKWSGGHLAFFNRGNPERIAAQLAIYGIDSGAKDFYLRTPKKWKANGYTVNDDARPIFVITPLFNDDDKKKAEADGAAIIEADAPADGEKASKGRKKHYACHAVFCPADVTQEREVKRRGPRKQKVTTDDYRAASHASPAPAAKKPRKATPAPAPAAFTPPADSADLMQMALAL